MHIFTKMKTGFYYSNLHLAEIGLKKKLEMEKEAYLENLKLLEEREKEIDNLISNPKYCLKKYDRNDKSNIHPNLTWMLGYINRLTRELNKDYKEQFGIVNPNIKSHRQIVATKIKNYRRSQNAQRIIQRN